MPRPGAPVPNNVTEFKASIVKAVLKFHDDPAIGLRLAQTPSVLDYRFSYTLGLMRKAPEPYFWSRCNQELVRLLKAVVYGSDVEWPKHLSLELIQVLSYLRPQRTAEELNASRQKKRDKKEKPFQEMLARRLKTATQPTPTYPPGDPHGSTRTDRTSPHRG